jgi:phage terminase large subunit-like protein
MGIAFPEDEFAADYQDATTDARKMSKFLRYSLNVWQAGDSRWMVGSIDWAACNAGPAEPNAGRPCWVGVDLASNLDMTAAAFVFKERDGSYSVEWKYWVPRETVADRVREGIPYDAWIRDGWVTVTDGHRLDHEAVARDIVAYGQDHEIRAVGVDPWQAGALETLLQREGLTVKDIPQRTGYLNAPCKLLEALVVEKRLRHGGNPVATWNANNVCVYTDATGMIKPDKAKSTEKIDGIAALVNGLALASTDEDASTSVDDWKVHVL